MAKTIPQLTDATTVGASDELIIQQGGVTKRATATELFGGAAFDNTAINTGGIALFATQTSSATRKILGANPVNGGRVVIDGVMRQFTEGLQLDTTAYNAETLYYVYVYWTGSAVALELSTTTWAFSFGGADSGIAVKSGDTSRTLVGLVWLDANKEIINNAQNAHLINWYNQRLRFLAGQLSAQGTSPDTWAQYAVTVTSRFDSTNPADFNSSTTASAAAWQEIGTASDNKIRYLAWRPILNQSPAVVMGISGSAFIDGDGQRLRISFGTTRRGAGSPVSSIMAFTAGGNLFFSNVSGASTQGAPQGENVENFHEVNVWAQIVGAARAATGVAATDVVTCTGNTFQNNLPVRFLSLTGGAGLSANTRYFVRELSGADFKLSTTALFSGVTGVASTDVITVAGHTFTNNQIVRFTSLTGGSGLTTATDYYVRDISGNTFKLSATSGGAAIDFTTNITAGSIGAPIINFTTDISAASIDANGAAVFINSFASFWG